MLIADHGAARHAAVVHLETMGALLLAADAAAAYIGDDRRGSAGRRRPRAPAGARLRGRRTPALAALAVLLPLNRRKREIATLAAGGLSNRQIDDRLMVSVRAVEGRLYHACTKLGTGDRTNSPP